MWIVEMSGNQLFLLPSAKWLVFCSSKSACNLPGESGKKKTGNLNLFHLVYIDSNYLWEATCQRRTVSGHIWSLFLQTGAFRQGPLRSRGQVWTQSLIFFSWETVCCERTFKLNLRNPLLRRRSCASGASQGSAASRGSPETWTDLPQNIIFFIFLMN